MANVSNGNQDISKNGEVQISMEVHHCYNCKHYLASEDMCEMCMEPLWGKYYNPFCRDFE